MLSNGTRQRRRRRRKRDNDSGEEDLVVKKKKMMDRNVFVSVVAKNCLMDIERALEPMMAVNDVFVLKRGWNEIGETLQIILIDEVSQTMILTSPKSGMYTYMYNDEDNEWIGVNDGHSFKGMITRDLIQQCHGLPNF